MTLAVLATWPMAGGAENAHGQTAGASSKVNGHVTSGSNKVNGQASSSSSASEKHIREGLRYVGDDNFPLAMQCFTRAMETADRDGDRRMQAVSAGYVGNVYYNLFDYPRCLQYYTRGYDLAVSLGDRPLQSNFLTNIVAAYCRTGDIRQARAYFARTLDLRRDTVGTPHMDYYILYDSARIAAAAGRTSRAIAIHHETLRFAQDNNLEEALRLYQLCEIGQLYLASGRPDSALVYGERCLPKAQRLGNRDFLTSVYQLLADSHAALHHEADAERFRQMYFGLSDSLFNRKFVSTADGDLMNYENRRTDQRISSLHHTILWQVVVIVIIVAVVVALTVLTRRLQRTNRRLLAAQLTVLDKNKELQRQEDRLKKEEHDSELKDNRKEIKEENNSEGKDNREKIKDGRAEVEDNRLEIKEEGAFEGEEETTDKGTAIDEELARTLLPRIARAMDDLALISNPDFSLQMLAESVGSNTRYVSAIINDRYGKNFKTLLNEHRIRTACTRLADREHYGHMTIQAIYEEVGYTNAVSFIRAFRKFNGMTPSEYQKIAAGHKRSSDD